jgi:hypothetical protein
MKKREKEKKEKESENHRGGKQQRNRDTIHSVV